MKTRIWQMVMMALVALGSFVLVAPAEAGKGKKKLDPEAMFKAMDTSPADGKVTSDEWKAFWAKKQAERAAKGKTAKKGKDGARGKLFKKLDTNNDGVLSLEEFKKISELKSKRGKKKKTS